MFMKRYSFAWAKNQLTMRKVMNVNTQQTKLPLLKQQQKTFPCPMQVPIITDDKQFVT